MQLDPDLVEAELRGGWIVSREHPDLPLSILNYSRQTQYAGLWTKFRKMARALVIDDDYKIVARGPGKFFNWQEIPPEDFPPGNPTIYDKVDGSFILTFYYGNRLIVASKGSFVSDHVGWAREIINEKLGSPIPPGLEDNWASWYELLHPDNRIVVDYEGQRDLVYLGSGDIYGNEMFLPPQDFTVVERFDDLNFTTRAELDTLPARKNREGYVLRWPNGFRVKWKSEEYVELHRILTGINDRQIFEAVRDGRFADILDVLPDEWDEWARGLAETYRKWQSELLIEIYDNYNSIPKGLERKEFAMAARRFDHPSIYFSLLDNRDISKYVWKVLEEKFKQNRKDAPFRGTVDGDAEDE